MKYLYWLLGLVFLALLVGKGETKPQQRHSGVRRKMTLPDVTKCVDEGLLQPYDITEHSLRRAGARVIELVSAERNVVLLYTVNADLSEKITLREDGRKTLDAALLNSNVISVTFPPEPTRYDRDVTLLMSGQLHALLHAVRSSVARLNTHTDHALANA